jgi:hypothetical protein
MYTIFSAVLRQQRKSDVMTSFGHSARSAVYHKAISHYMQATVKCGKTQCQISAATEFNRKGKATSVTLKLCAVPGRRFALLCYK